MIVLIALAAKNGIFVVEFAKVRREAGHPLHEARLKAPNSRNCAARSL
jgi:multidrug efflux pump subunit AcrB